MNSKVISVFGLGKLGCSMLACFALKGWRVIGVDIIKDVVDQVGNGHSPVYEPDVEELLQANRNRISATLDTREALLNSDISFIIVPTPSSQDGSFSTEYVEIAIAEIGSILREKSTYHTVVVTSTVLPGDMQKIKRLLERTSKKVCGQDFGLCYNPDFIALGSIVHDFLNPDMILIGESDSQAGDILESIHKELVDSHPNIHRMNFYNAELSKIALNSYCTLKITFANKLAELCEAMPEGDANVVAQAIGDDSRIGRKYFRGGLSYGGPCFPRDNRAIANAALRYGVDMPLARLTDTINNEQKNIRIPQRIISLLEERDNPSIAVLGCTYKKDTSLTEESAVIPIIKALCESGFTVKVYDPAGNDNAAKDLAHIHSGLTFCSSATECLKACDLALIGTGWDEFKELDCIDFEKNMNTDFILFDACSGLNEEVKEKFKTIQIGVNS